MTGPPQMTQFGAGMYAWLEPIAVGEESNGYPVGVLCGGIGEMFRDGEQLVRALPDRDVWQVALDIDRAPDWHLDWLGQLVGVRGMQSLSADQKRTKIKAEAGFYRGSVDALRAAIAATLTGDSPRILVEERSSDAWTITVVTDPANTPDSAATTIAMRQATVAGLIPTLVVTSAPRVDDGTRTVDAAAGTATVDSAGFPDVT